MSVTSQPTPRSPELVSQTSIRTLLLVDDESGVLSALKRVFRRERYRVLTASGGLEALEQLASTNVDVIVSDQRMPGMTGVDFLRQVRLLYPDTIRITLSGFADLQSIIDAVNEGAVYKFLVKPWDDDRLRKHVRDAFEQKELADENRRLHRELSDVNVDLESLNQRLADSLDQQHKQALLVEASAAMSRDLVDVLPVAVFGVDPEGLLAYCNKAAIDLMPVAAAGLGSPLQFDLANLFYETSAASTAKRTNEGHDVVVAQGQHRAWMCSLDNESALRGSILVVAPSCRDHLS